MATITRGAPSGVIVSHGVVVTSTPLVASATLAAGWQNPESVGVFARAIVHFTTGGTGTVDLGLGTAGTGGAAVQFIDGGTMAAGVISGNNAAGSAGTLGGGDWEFVGANGAATDSIVLNHNEAATGTYAGNMYVHYFIAES